MTPSGRVRSGPVDVDLVSISSDENSATTSFDESDDDHETINEIEGLSSSAAASRPDRDLSSVASEQTGKSDGAFSYSMLFNGDIDRSTTNGLGEMQSYSSVAQADDETAHHSTTREEEEDCADEIESSHDGIGHEDDTTPSIANRKGRRMRMKKFSEDSDLSMRHEEKREVEEVSELAYEVQSGDDSPDETAPNENPKSFMTPPRHSSTKSTSENAKNGDQKKEVTDEEESPTRVSDFPFRQSKTGSVVPAENDRSLSPVIHTPPGLRRESSELVGVVLEGEKQQSQEQERGSLLIDSSSEALKSPDDAADTSPRRKADIPDPEPVDEKTPPTTSEAERLNGIAGELLSRGRNAEALETYSRAMHCARGDMVRVKRLIQRMHNQRRRARSSSPEKQGKDEGTTLQHKLNSNLISIASTIADILNNIGVVYEMEEKYDAAIASCRDALDVYHNTCHRYEHTGDPDVDRTVKNITQMELAKRSCDKRKRLHKHAAKLANDLAKETDPVVRRGLKGDVVNTLRTALNLERETLGPNHPTVANTLLKIGKFHFVMQNIDSAVREMNHAIVVLRNSLGSFHPHYGRALLTLASVFDKPDSSKSGASEKARALKLYRQAVPALKAALGDVHPEVGATYNNIGVILHRKGDHGQAMQAFYDALKGYGVRWKNEAGHKGQGAHPDVAFVWINIGELHIEHKAWGDALRAYQKARSALRKLKRISAAMPSDAADESDKFDRLIASTLQNIGMAQTAMKRYGKAIEAYGEALRIHKAAELRYVDGRGGYAQSTDERSAAATDVARILESLGEVEMFGGNLSSAMSHYIHSLNLHRSTHRAKSAIDIASVLGSIGLVHLKRHEYVEAEIVLNEALQLYKANGVSESHRMVSETRTRLVDAEVAIMAHSSLLNVASKQQDFDISGKIRDFLQTGENDDKALVCDELAEAHKNKGDYEGAIWFYSEALSIRRSKVESDAEHTDKARSSSDQIDIGRTMSNIAQMLQRKRQCEAAKILYDQALRVYKTNGLERNHPYVRDLLHELDVMRHS